jgi:hypothetical protein
MTATAHHSHRVTRAVADARADLTEVADASVWSMDAAATMATLDDVQMAKAQLAEIEARLLSHAQRIQLPAETGAASTANWHAHRTRTTRRHAHRLMRLAKSLDQHDAIRTALAEGRLHFEQAEAILSGLAELPGDLELDLIEQAEAHLIEQAADFDANGLRNLARRLLEVVAPDAADAHEAKLLEREERDAAAATRLTVWQDGKGRLQGRFTLDGLTGAMFTKHLLALAAPRHRASKGPLGERRPTPERLGQAFAELIQRYPAKRLPKAGGLNATVVVTMPLETLRGGLKAAKLDTGQTISPSMARKLACEAGIIPAVLGGKSQVLDLGRKKRFYDQYQRIAKTIEQGGCAVEGCDWPPGMCHMHHPIRWVDGGGTNRDGIMICPAHHARAHDQRYDMTQLPTGKYTFHRRT